MKKSLLLKLIKEDCAKRNAEIERLTPAMIIKSKHCKSFKQYLKDAHGYLHERFYKEMLLHLDKEQIIISDWSIDKGGSTIEVMDYSGNVICRRVIKRNTHSLCERKFREWLWEGAKKFKSLGVMEY